MMNIFNKAKGLRKQNAIKSQLSSLGLKLPSTSFSTVGTSQNSNNEVSLNERIKQMSLKDLIEQRVESTEYMDLAERTDFLERFCKVDNSSLTERTAKSQKKLFEKFGDNAVRIVDNRLVKVVDALKSHPIIRPSNFSYQTSLDNYKFKDGRDYQVLQRTDELEGLSRLNYLEMQNTHFLNKMKHVLEEGDHFSKFESNYQAEDYLEGKPDTYLIVQNIPGQVSHNELYLLLSKYGTITKFNLRRTPLGYPAFFEVLFENADSVNKAKQELNRKRFHGKVLYLKDHRDKDYEHPLNRTLVIQGINRSENAQQLIEKLSQFGAVVNFELATEIQSNAAPSKQELLDYLNSQNLSEDAKRQITLDTIKFDEEDDMIFTENVKERLADQIDVRENYDFDTASKETQAQFEERLIKNKQQKDQLYAERVFGNSNAKEYKVVEDHSVLLRDIPNIYSALTARQKSGSLQYFIKELQDIKSKISKASQLSLQEKITINNRLETPTVQNKGYLFVTFATTDQAKFAMLEIPTSFDFSHDVKVSLKKDNSHIDFDTEFFEENYLKLREEINRKTKNLDETIKESEKAGTKQKKFNEFKQKFYGNNVEEVFKEATIKKNSLDPSKTPQHAYNQSEKEKEDVMMKFQADMEKFIEETTEKNFSTKSAFELNIANNADAEYEVGRSFSTKLKKRDIDRFLNQVNRKQDEISSEEHLSTKNYQDAVAELLAKSKGLTSPEDSEMLSKFKKYVEDNNPEKINKELDKEIAEFRADARKFQQFRDSRELRKKRAIERRLKQQEVAEENTYYNPFQNQLLFRKKGVPQDTYINASYEQRKARFMEKVRMAVTGEYDDAHLVDLLKVSQNESSKKRKLDNYLYETDKDGYKYITEADIERFDQDNEPEDPIEKLKYEAEKKRKDTLRNSPVVDDVKLTLEKHPELGTLMMNNGIPVDTLDFEPNDQYKTAEEMAEKLNFLDSEHEYIPITTDDKSYLVKMAKKKYKYDIEFFQSQTPDEFQSDINKYLLENGLTEVELNKALNDEFENEDEMNAINQKVIEILSTRVPAHILEAVNSQTDFESEEYLSEIREQLEVQVAKEKVKALKKEDLVKFSSTLFNTQVGDKGFKRSQYDDL